MYNKLTYIAKTIALMALVSACTSSGSDSPDEPQSTLEMRFAAKESAESRSTLVNNETFKESPFVVYGDMIQNDAATGVAPNVVFNGRPVTYKESAWTYDNVEYWFPGFTYSFVAVHPSNAVSPSYLNNTLSFTYTIDDYTKTVDLLTATHRRRCAAGSQTPVSFNFSHILTQLNFVAKVESEFGKNVVFKSFKLEGIYNTARYSITPSLLQSGSLSTEDYTGGWTIDQNVAPVTLFTLDSDKTVSPGGDPYTIFATDNPLLVIPQNVPQDLKFTATYIIEGDTDVKQASGYLYNAAVLAHLGIWRPGRSYTYSFSIGVNDYIIFQQPSIKDWIESEGGNYVVN